MLHSHDAASAIANASRPPLTTREAGLAPAARLAAATVAAAGYPALTQGLHPSDPGATMPIHEIVADAEARAAARGADIMTSADLLDALTDTGALDADTRAAIDAKEHAGPVSATLDRLEAATARAAHLDCLGRRQAAFVAQRYGLAGDGPARLAEVSSQFGVSREAGRMILSGAETSIGVAALQRAAASGANPDAL